MTAISPNTLGHVLRGFFADHLPRVRGASPHTVRSYRDTFVLLLRFIATQKHRSVPELDVDHVDPKKYSTSFMISKSSATIWRPLAT